MKMEWSEPPPEKYAADANFMGQFVAELRRNPGRWARWPKTVKYHAQVGYMRTKFPDTEWVARKVDGTINVWARTKETP